MLGYWNDEENTKKTLTEDGWLKTGDQFILQENGYGTIVGRLKDMLIRGGENIFPKVSTIINSVLLTNYLINLIFRYNRKRVENIKKLNNILYKFS